MAEHNLTGTLTARQSLQGTVGAKSPLQGVINKSETVYEKNYEILDNKPSINSRVLIGDRSLESLGVNDLIETVVQALSNADIESILR